MSKALARGCILISIMVSSNLAAQSANPEPCPEMVDFFNRTPPWVRQLMAVNDELHPTLERMRKVCDNRFSVKSRADRRSALGENTARAEDRARVAAQSDRGEYADLGKN
jgi:hypothetical protein